MRGLRFSVCGLGLSFKVSGFVLAKGKVGAFGVEGLGFRECERNGVNV